MRTVDFNGQTVTPSKVVCVGKNYAFREKRLPVTLTTGVWPTGAQVVPVW